MQYVRPYRGRLAAALLCAVAGVGLQLWAPVLIGQAINCIVGPGDVNMTAVQPILVQLALAIVGSSIGSYAMTRLTNGVAYRTVRTIRDEAFARLQEVQENIHEKSSKKDKTNKIRHYKQFFVYV